MPREAYIVDAVRTPVGKKKGGLAHIHSADLGAHSIKALMERTKVDPEAVDDVIFGCCDAIGWQSGDIARTCWYTAGLPLGVPGVTIDRQCGSGQQAVHFAAQGIMSGTQDLVVAGGVQNMNQIPITSAMVAGREFGMTDPFSQSKGFKARYPDVEQVSQFRSADMIAKKWEITREQMEQYAFESHQRAAAAIKAGYFKNEIAPIEGVSDDETVRSDTTLEKMATLKPLEEGSWITAAVSSQNADASAAILVASEDAIKRFNLKPRARIHHMSVRADDPVWMLTAPISATRYAMKRSGMKLEDIDIFECNEAFASIPMAWMKELGIPREKVNVNGGGISLGHPIGATGARLMTSMLNEMERRKLRYGLQTMCEGGGQANVTIIERL
jgi:acetyl-CoA C-acetyltransferase